MFRNALFASIVASVLLAALLVSALANAAQGGLGRNILFVDLNNAQPEIAALRAALAPSDQLIVTPSANRLSASTRTKVLAVKKQYDAVERRARDCKMSQRLQCEVLWSEMQRLDAERDALIGAFKVSDLLEDVRKQTQRAFDMVLISGHHSGSYFQGEIGALEANDLLQLTFAAPELFAAVRSVVLLGCETGVPSLIGDLFVKVFPNASLIVGAEDSAPLRDETRNLRFIRAVLGNEAALTGNATQRDVALVHRTLISERWPVAILWQREYYFSKGWSGKLIDMPPAIARSFKIGAEGAMAAATTAVAPLTPQPRSSGHDSPIRTPTPNNAPLLSPNDAINVLRD
jgi:hypothetical protein